MIPVRQDQKVQREIQDRRVRLDQREPPERLILALLDRPENMDIPGRRVQPDLHPLDQPDRPV